MLESVTSEYKIREINIEWFLAESCCLDIVEDILRENNPSLICYLKKISQSPTIDHIRNELKKEIIRNNIDIVSEKHSITPCPKCSERKNCFTKLKVKNEFGEISMEQQG